MVHYKSYMLSLRPQSLCLGDTKKEFQKIAIVEAAYGELLFNRNLKPVLRFKGLGLLYTC